MKEELKLIAGWHPEKTIACSLYGNLLLNQCPSSRTEMTVVMKTSSGWNKDCNLLWVTTTGWRLMRSILLLPYNTKKVLGTTDIQRRIYIEFDVRMSNFVYGWKLAVPEVPRASNSWQEDWLSPHTRVSCDECPDINCMPPATCTQWLYSVSVYNDAYWFAFKITRFTSHVSVKNAQLTKISHGCCYTGWITITLSELTCTERQSSKRRISCCSVYTHDQSNERCHVLFLCKSRVVQRSSSCRQCSGSLMAWRRHTRLLMAFSVFYYFTLITPDGLELTSPSQVYCHCNAVSLFVDASMSALIV